MSNKHISILTPISKSNLNIHEKAWLDISSFISKEEFMEMPLYWYFNYALLRVFSTDFCKVEDIDLKEKFKEDLVDLFQHLSVKERKELFTIVLNHLNRSTIGDHDKTKIYKKYITNTTLEASSIWGSSLLLKKSTIEDTLNNNQKKIYEEVEEALNLEIMKNQKGFYLTFNHLNNLDVLFDFKANNIEEMLNFKSDIEKCMSYSRVLELELIFLKNKSVQQNLIKVQKIFDVAFEGLVKSIESKSIDLFKYDMPVNFFSLIYSFSNKDDKKEIALNLINEMFKSKDEVFYEHDRLKLFYALYSMNIIGDKDIVEGEFPKMLNKIIHEDKNSLSLNLIYLKRASLVYEMLETNPSLRKTLFKDIEITDFAYYKNINGCKVRSQITDEMKKKTMYNSYKSSVITLDDLPEIYKMFEVRPYFKIDYKKKENINNDVYQDSEMSANIVYKLKDNANIDLIKDILLKLIVTPQDIFVENAEALIDKLKMIEDVGYKGAKRESVRHKVNKF